jgi:hypothetical protein
MNTQELISTHTNAVSAKIKPTAYSLQISVATEPAAYNKPRSLTTPYILLHGPIVSGWQIVKPLFVMLEQDEGGSFIVSDDIFVVYGTGDTGNEALDDYIMSLIDYYELLAERRDDPPTEAQFHILQQYLHQYKA